MVNTIKRSEVLRLLEILGHDPNQVSSVNITPGYVTVEYMHPMVNDDRKVAAHEIVNNP